MGGKSTTSTQSVSIPPEVMARYNAVNARAEDVAQQPFKQYGGEFVAPLTPTQQAGIGATSAYSQSAQPFYGAATGLTLAGAQDVGKLTGRQIGQYMDPFVGSVVQPTLEALQQQQGQERTQLQSQAIKSGAFGGDRAGLERANLARQQGLGTAQAIAPLLSQGYQQAVQTAQGQQGVQAADLARRMQAGQQIAGLGTGAQQAALQGAQAQIGAGTLQQQTQQAQDTAQYQQFLQERGYPFQVAQFLANIAMGTGALSGSTTTTTQPGGFFSDERLKDNIEPIGKTFDGQPIYRYDYGDGRTQIGLIAQDVLARGKPGVGRDKSGYLTVDYRDATDDAAAMASMGGAVEEPGHYERGGYVGGGVVGSEDIKNILAAQAQSFGPFSQSGLYGGQGAGAGAPGAAGIVPSAKLPVTKLATAGNMPSQQPSGFSQAAKAGESIAGLYKTGKEVKKDYQEWQDGRAAAAKKAADEAAKNAGTAATAAKPGVVPAKGPTVEGAPKQQVSDAGESPLGAAPKQVADVDPSLIGGDSFGSVMGAKRGGLIVHRHHYDEGGPVDEDATMPYGNDAMGNSKDILGDVVKSGSQHVQSLPKPGEPPKQAPGLGSDLMQAAGMIGGLKTLGSAAASAASAIPEWLAVVGLPFGLAHGGVARNPFEYGGLVPRQAHAEGDEVIATSDSDQPQYKIQPQKKEEMEPHWQDFINYVYPREGGLDKEGKPRYNIRQGAQETFDTEAGHPGLKPARGGQSSAAGAGQFINATWNRVTGGAPMTEGYQDAAMKALATDDYKKRTGRDLDADLREKGLTTEIKSALKPTWMGIDAPMPPGLVGRKDADLPARGATEAQYREQEPGLIDSLGDKLTSERYMVPALSFLGSMLASKSPFLGQAIGEGLVGGVAGYQSMQKQQMEMAKNLIDVVGNRFERTIENGQVVYRNKLTDEKVPPGQMQATIFQMFKKAGLNPEQYGIMPPSGPVPPTSTATKLTAAGGDPKVGSVTTTGEMPKISTSEVGGAEKPAGTEGKKAIPAKDITDMDPLELRNYYEQHGIWPEGDNPRNIRAQITKLMQQEKDASNIGGKEFLDQANKYREERRALETRLDALLDKAVSTQMATNAEVQKGRAGQAIELEKNIGTRQDSRAMALSNWNRFAQIIADKDTGRLQPAIAGLTSVISDLGLKVDPKKLNDAAQFDLALKLSMKEVYDSMARENLVRAPAASQKGLSMTVPGPQMITGAPYEILGRIVGELNYMRERDNAYLDQQGAGKEVSPARFYRRYDEKNGEKALNKHIATAFNELPANEKIPREFYDSMYRSYGKHGYVPPNARESAPAAGSALPEPLQGVEGLVYSPSRKQYRDGQGNIYDATGKRVQ
jgi:hypothetical protein